MIRAFIAVEIPGEVRGRIAEAQARLRRAPVSVRISWVKIENLHLTLQFLGHIDEAVVPAIREALEAVARRHAPFEVAVQGAGAFPSVARPRVIWVGCAAGARELEALAGAVQAAMEPLGFPREQRAFAAHLTLGRLKVPRADAALTKALDSVKNADLGRMRVEAIHLVQSQLDPQGSIYTKLSSHRLGGTALA